MELKETSREINLKLRTEVEFEVGIEFNKEGSVSSVHINGEPAEDSYFGWQLEDEIKELVNGKMDGAKFLDWRVHFEMDDNGDKVVADGYYDKDGVCVESDVSYIEKEDGTYGDLNEEEEVLKEIEKYKPKFKEA